MIQGYDRPPRGAKRRPRVRRLRRRAGPGRSWPRRRQSATLPDSLRGDTDDERGGDGPPGRGHPHPRLRQPVRPADRRGACARPARSASWWPRTCRSTSSAAGSPRASSSPAGRRACTRPAPRAATSDCSSSACPSSASATACSSPASCSAARSSRAEAREYGRAKLDDHRRQRPARGACPRSTTVWMSHGDQVAGAGPTSFVPLAATADLPVRRRAAPDASRSTACSSTRRSRTRRTASTSSATSSTRSAAAPGTWRMADFLERESRAVREQVGDGAA